MLCLTHIIFDMDTSLNKRILAHSVFSSIVSNPVSLMSVYLRTSVSYVRTRLNYYKENRSRADSTLSSNYLVSESQRMPQKNLQTFYGDYWKMTKRGDSP